ncbi:hypothetical protein D1007_04769 [Hordeum vulgare]|nr:hypothetical protein D1007_04769 [Hordeum vulgare]
MDPNDEVKLIGKYGVGVRVKSRLKSMPITSKLHWKVYKDIILESQDKSLELFVTKIELLVVQLDLNRHATSLIHDGRMEVYVPNSSSQPPNEEEMNDRAMVIQKEEVHVDVDVAHVVDDDACVYGDIITHDDAYAEAEEINYNPIGNLDVILYRQDMYHSLPYSRMYGYDLDDECPVEELNEDGVTAQENEIFMKMMGKERGAPLFRDLSLANKVVVDGGMRLGLFEPTPCPKVGDPKPKDEDNNAHLKKGIKFGCLENYYGFTCYLSTL